jgi:hypothetical protein
MKLARSATLILLVLFAPLSMSQPQRGAIRSIDFANFTYPAHAANLTYSSRTAKRKPSYTLRQGELKPKYDKRGHPISMWLKLGNVNYFDVTGDGREEAIVDLAWITGGSAMPDLVYIYTFRNGRPKLLWTFETGDRADGGLKDIHTENGKLVVELYGKNKVIGRDFYGGDDDTKNGDCCPTMFTRTKYVWRGNRFQRFAKPDVHRLEK